MLKIKVKGNTDKTESFLRRAMNANKISIGRLEHYGQMGVDALAQATPVNTGLTASSWSYEIVQKEKTISLIWKNSNVVDGYPVAILIQYGHGTRNGGYVQGIDYINPALKPVFDKISNDIWTEVVGNNG